MAATAITSTDIERAGINNIQDVAQLTPNLVIIDHRIGSAGAAPTIDLRTFGASNPYRRE